MRAVAWLMEIRPRDVWECMENPPSFGGGLPVTGCFIFYIIREMFIDFGTAVYSI